MLHEEGDSDIELGPSFIASWPGIRLEDAALPLLGEEDDSSADFEPALIGTKLAKNSPRGCGFTGARRRLWFVVDCASAGIIICHQVYDFYFTCWTVAICFRTDAAAAAWIVG